MPATPWTGNDPISPLAAPQLSAYLQHVSSGSLTLSAIQRALSLPSGPQLVLKTLIRLHTSKILWGSIASHYSLQSRSPLNPEDLFERFVVRKLGSHCLEMVPLFAAVLRALGYWLYLTGARISAAMAGGHSAGVGYHGWSHVVLIFTIEGQKYVVDPQYLHITEAVRLDPKAGDVVFDSIPHTAVRLRYTAPAELVPNGASNSGLMAWVFEYKLSRSNKEWTPSYIFSTETEWFSEDLDIMNIWLARAEESYLVKQLVIKRLLLVGEGDFGVDKAPKNSMASFSRDDGRLVESGIAGTVQLVDQRLTV